MLPQCQRLAWLAKGVFFYSKPTAKFLGHYAKSWLKSGPLLQARLLCQRELLRSGDGILEVTGFTAIVKNAEPCVVLGGLLSAIFFEKGT